MSNEKMNINVTVNGKPITIPEDRQQPFVYTNEQRTYVPIREIFEHLDMGFKVEWESGVGENPMGTVTATNSHYIVKMKEGETQLEVNGIRKDFPYGVSPQVISGNNVVGGSFMIPLRGVFENVGCTLEYDATTKTANVVTHHNTYYKIKNTAGKYLTYLPTLTDDDRIKVKDNDTETPDLQIWKIEPSSKAGKYWVKPVQNTTKAMNVYQSSNSGYPNTICYVYDETKQYPDNSTDTSLIFEIDYDPDLNSFYTQKIKWESETGNVVRYLACREEETYWSTTDDPEIWTLEPVFYPTDFQVNNGTTYKLAAFAGSVTADTSDNIQYSLKYLSVGSTVINEHREVFISNSTADNTWKVSSENGQTKLLVANDETYRLYYYRTSANLGNPVSCDAYPHENNEEAFVEFEMLSDMPSHLPVCRIHLVRNDINLYLTADDFVDGASVSWNYLNSENQGKQLWYLVPMGDDINTGDNGENPGENDATTTDFCWPTQSHTITQVFNINTHKGIDIFPMIENKVGDKIYAIADGVVERRFEWNEGDSREGNGAMGRCLYISHSPSNTNTALYMRSIYMHLDEVHVVKGQAVKKGDIIGTMGHTGECISSNGGNGTHLHFALKTKETEFLDGGYDSGGFVDPMDYEYYNHG